MITRRRFLRQSALTPVAAVAAVTAPGASGSSGDTQDEPRRPLPASIASLTSLRDQARPISMDERLARLEKARRLMTAQKIDAMVLVGGTSLTYFSGARWGNSERLMALVVPARGEPYGVVPAFEEDRVREQLALGPLGRAELRLWHEDESPFERVAQGLKDRGLATGRHRPRRDREVRLQRRDCGSRPRPAPDQRHTGDCGLPHDQGQLTRSR